MEFGAYADANVLQFQQYYNLSTTKMAMRDSIRDTAGLLQMLPDRQQCAGRPNSGDVPAIRKGSFVDVYA